MERIPLLRHHARTVIEYWLKSCKGTIEEIVQNHVIPLHENEKVDGEFIYSFLKDPELKQNFVTGFITAFRHFVEGNYEEIPEMDPETGEANVDIICENCGNVLDGACRFYKD